MKFIELHNAQDLEQFYSFGNKIYSNNKFYRSDNDIMRLVIKGPSDFHNHAKIIPILVQIDKKTVARFAFIHDKTLPEYIQVSFFEAIKGIDNLTENITKLAKEKFPKTNKICFGLNGHLNYGAGILLNNFDKIPVFGLPYNHSYYPDYFRNMTARKITSFSFLARKSEYFNKLKNRIKTDSNISIRKLDKKKLVRDSEIYTKLNNECFQEHPYWANRTNKEDLELFEPFRFLLQNENLIFAEYKGKPVGFLLWFPDFYQLLKRDRELKAAHHLDIDVLRFKFLNKINTFRFTEIAIHPDFRKKSVEMLLINQMVDDVISAGYKYGTGGFIFDENKDSINLALKYIERITGEKVSSDSKYAVFETKLR